MTLASAAANRSKKLVKFTFSLFCRRFNSSKCKTVARIKLLRNKRHVVVKQMSCDIALLLHSGQDATARIRDRLREEEEVRSKCVPNRRSVSNQSLGWIW